MFNLECIQTGARGEQNNSDTNPSRALEKRPNYCSEWRFRITRVFELSRLWISDLHSTLLTYRCIEIVIEVLKRVPDIGTLKSLVRASPKAHAVYVSSGPEVLLTQATLNELGV